VATRKTAEQPHYQEKPQQQQPQQKKNDHSSANKSTINSTPPRSNVRAASPSSPSTSPANKTPTKAFNGILDQRTADSSPKIVQSQTIAEPVEQAFAKFVVNERTARKNEKDKEASNLINDLKSFSQKLKLKSPVPPDLQEMFASSKRKPVTEEAKGGAGPPSPSPSNASSSTFKFNAKASTFTPNAGAKAFVPVRPSQLS
jgi:hypothetical protein